MTNDLSEMPKGLRNSHAQPEAPHERIEASIRRLSSAKAEVRHLRDLVNGGPPEAQGETQRPTPVRSLAEVLRDAPDQIDAVANDILDLVCEIRNSLF